MNSLHIRRTFLKLARRAGLIGVSALGAGTALGLGTARSAQSQQTSDGKQVQDLVERVKSLEVQLQNPARIAQLNTGGIKTVDPGALKTNLDLKTNLETDYRGGSLTVGNREKSSQVYIYGGPKGETKRPVIRLVGGSDRGTGQPTPIVLDGEKGDISVGGTGVSGNINIFEAKSSGKAGEERISLRGDLGHISLRGSDNNHHIHLFGGAGRIQVGGNGINGSLSLYPADAPSPIGPILNIPGKPRKKGPAITFSANDSTIRLSKAAGGESILLDGSAGDILLCKCRLCRRV